MLDDKNYVVLTPIICMKNNSTQLNFWKCFSSLIPHYYKKPETSKEESNLYRF